jgi:hypothetical protein
MYRTFVAGRKPEQTLEVEGFSQLVSDFIEAVINFILDFLLKKDSQKLSTIGSK